MKNTSYKRSTDIVTQETNHSFCYFSSREGRKQGAGGQSSKKTFGTTPSPSSRNALFDKEKALQKGHFCSFAEKGRGLDPQDPLVGRLFFLKLHHIYIYMSY